MAAHVPQARSLYRRILRELPSRSPSLLANPSPIQQHVRSDFSHDSPSASLAHQTTQKSFEQRLHEGEEFVKYLSAQRMYTTLLERYNPGMNMSEEEKVRLSARRVGVNLPVDTMRGTGGGQV